jgi:hypothetical protein
MSCIAEKLYVYLKIQILLYKLITSFEIQLICLFKIRHIIR